MSRLDEPLRAIATMDKAGLKDRWAALTGRPAPRASTAMLRLAVAYELQAKALGGLSRQARQRLSHGGGQKPQAMTVRPGMRLVREHGGAVHVVTIGEAGEIIWNDQQWRSLSEVARTITGTRWSGPAFFGLKDRKTAA